jgi:hypothetical protein
MDKFQRCAISVSRHSTAIWIATLALFIPAATLPALAASTIVVGQHLKPQLVALSRPMAEFVWTRGIGAPATAPRAAASVPATRSYMAGWAGQVADPQGTRVYVNVWWRDQGVYGYATIAVDSPSGRVVDSVDLLVADPMRSPHVSSLVLDAAHGRLLTLSATATATTAVKIAANPLAVTGSWLFPCDRGKIASLWAMSSDGARVYASCGHRILLLDADDGTIEAVAEMESDVGSLLLDAQTDTVVATTSVTGSSTTAIQAYDAATLVSRASYTVPLDPTLLAIDKRGEVVFVAIIMNVGEHLFTLDLASRAVVDRGNSVAGNFYAESQGRSGQLIGVDRSANCTRADCASHRIVRYDTSGFAITDEIGIDERAADDPTRENLYAGIDFIAVAPRVQRAVEFFHAVLGHYFVTADANEIAALDAGQFAGWTRTGETFPVFASAGDTEDVTTPVCRYYGRPEKGIDSHFYSASPVECAAVEAMFGDSWILETPQAFFVYAADPASGACPNATTPVYRLYNGRGDANHRYTTSTSIRAQMIAQGWIAEGYGPQAIGFCVPRS